MARYNYDRVYSLTIGRPALIADPFRVGVTQPNSVSVLDAPVVDLKTADGVLDFSVVKPAEALEIRDLQIKSVIKGSTESKGNMPLNTIQIFNLNEEQRNFICNKNNLVILKGGYASDLDPDNLDASYRDLPILFTGQCDSYKTENMSADIVTTISCREGYTPFNSVKVSLSLGAPYLVGITYKDVFDRLVQVWQENGITIAQEYLIYEDLTPPLFTNPATESVPHGWSFEGYLSDAMDDICEHFNYTWYITNNTLFIHPKNQKNFQKVFEFTEEVIQDIKPATDNTRDDSSTPSEKGIKLKTFLNGRVTKGSVLKVPTEQYKGSYVVKSAVHSLDWRGSDWNTELFLEFI